MSNSASKQRLLKTNDFKSLPLSFLANAETSSRPSALQPEAASTIELGFAGSKLLTVTQWNAHHAWPPIGGLRHLIFFAETNGFSKVIRRVGRRVLIDEAAFYAWVNDHGVTL